MMDRSSASREFRRTLTAEAQSAPRKSKGAKKVTQ